MPTPPPADASQLAERALFARLVEDATALPPSRRTLAEGVHDHRELRHGPAADLVGPLLVRSTMLRDLVDGMTQGARRSEPLPVIVVAETGIDAGYVQDALAALERTPVLPVGIEVGPGTDWRALLGRGLPLSVGVPRGEALDTALADIARESSDDVPLQAVFSPRPRGDQPWVDETELAAFVRSAIDHELGFTLAGGILHAVRGRYPHRGTQEEQHGVLNVLLAVRWALNGDDVEELVPVLAERDPEQLLAAVRRMSTADAAITRAFFTAYGCKVVRQPLQELADLGLLDLSGAAADR